MPTLRERIAELLVINYISVKEIQNKLAEMEISASETRIKQLINLISRDFPVYEKKENRLGRIRFVYHLGVHTTHGVSCSYLNRKIA